MRNKINDRTFMWLLSISQLIFFTFRHYNEGDYMEKVESCIVCKQQALKNGVVIVDNTDSDDYSFNGCKDSSSSDDGDGITIASVYSTSIKGL